MNLYVCTDHDNFNPVGAASIVIAGSESEARDILYAALAARGLDADKPFTLEQVDTDVATVMILVDGDY